MTDDTHLVLPSRAVVYGTCRRCGRALDVAPFTLNGRPVEVLVCPNPACPVRLAD